MGEIQPPKKPVSFTTVRTASGARKMVEKHPEADDGLLVPDPTRRPKRGRPPVTGQVQRVFTVPVGVLRALHNAVDAAIRAPRAAETQAELRDVLSWTKARLGPMVDPDYAPPLGKRSFVFRITGADGSAVDCKTATEAATLYGVSEGGLKVMLSRGNGKCGRFVMHDGNPARVTCERLEVVAADGKEL